MPKARAPRHRLADAAHPDDAKALAPDAMAQHPGRRPSVPLAVLEDFQPFSEPPRHREDQRHRHVGGVFGQHARGIGDDDAALMRRDNVDIVDAVAEIGDQLEPAPGLLDHLGVDLVGDCRHQHVGALRGLGEFSLGHRPVVGVELDLEQLAHAGFDAVRQLAGNDDQGLFAFRHVPPFNR